MTRLDDRARLIVPPWTRMAGTYFAGWEGLTGPVKIGQSRNISRRLNDLQGGCPVILTVWDWVDSLQAEGIFHTHYRDKKLHREWFDVTLDEVLSSCDEWRANARPSLRASGYR